jgi:uncharacterized protein (TIGR02147 family)
MTEKITTQQWLMSELADKRASNPRYSLRLFATKLGFSPGRMSEYVSGKRQLSRKQAIKIAEKLSYSPQRTRDFLNCVDSDGFFWSTAVNSEPVYRKLNADTFSVVADWYHFAILSLMDLDDFQANEEWISSRIGVPKRTVSMAVERLFNVGLIKINNRKWMKVETDHSTTQDVPSAALRISHKQSLHQAAEALDSVSVLLRDISSITMAVNPDTIGDAKKMIKKFRRQLSFLMESGKKTEVYNLNIQLVPVTKIQIKEGNV